MTGNEVFHCQRQIRRALQRT
uniref:Uncharacterized protein n=1 Tax=Arundo donax TaxID=35708 RepID=A0A0A9DS34_ARUDO